METNNNTFLCSIASGNATVIRETIDILQNDSNFDLDLHRAMTLASECGNYEIIGFLRRNFAVGLEWPAMLHAYRNFDGLTVQKFIEDIGGKNATNNLASLIESIESFYGVINKQFVKAFKTLVNDDADLNIILEDGDTPLDKILNRIPTCNHCNYSGIYESINYLVSRGVKLHNTRLFSLKYNEYLDPISPLVCVSGSLCRADMSYADRRLTLDLIKNMLAAGMDVNINIAGSPTPIQALLGENSDAYIHPNDEMIECMHLFIKAGADVNCTSVSYFGRSLIHLAWNLIRTYTYFEPFRLEFPKTISGFDCRTFQVVWYPKYGSENVRIACDIIKLLIKCGVDINQLDDSYIGEDPKTLLQRIEDDLEFIEGEWGYDSDSFKQASDLIKILVARNK
jgi:hypothetical protein